jgi:Uma2 family endonuclease
VAVSSVSKLATLEDLAAIADHDRREIIHGSIVEKAAPSAEHSVGSTKIGAILDPFHRRPSGRYPGGWWLHTEVHVEYAKHELYCHDVAGWRRDRVPVRPTGWPVRIRPDWVCEIASPRHERRDFVDKLQYLHRAEVPHYWILHPEERMLLVHRWSAEGYVTILTATAGETIRAEPFSAIEIRVGELLGDDPED